MAKHSRTVHEAVEAQVGRCRAAAVSIDEALRHEEQPDPFSWSAPSSSGQWPMS